MQIRPMGDGSRREKEGLEEGGSAGCPKRQGAPIKKIRAVLVLCGLWGGQSAPVKAVMTPIGGCARIIWLHGSVG
jgi:hypothetical protein